MIVFDNISSVLVMSGFPGVVALCKHVVVRSNDQLLMLSVQLLSFMCSITVALAVSSDF